MAHRYHFLIFRTWLTLGCTISGFIGSVAALSEILSLATVSLDRFLVIQYPLIKRKQFSKNQVSFTKILNKIFAAKRKQNYFMLAQKVMLSIFDSGKRHYSPTLGNCNHVFGFSTCWMEQIRIRGKLSF